MTAPGTTKTQVQAYRFGVRRLERAVATGQAYRGSLGGGPRRGISFTIGFVLAALVLAGFAVYALISPAPSIGKAKVVINSDDGSVYVLRSHRLYPAMNLASALLAAGSTGGNNGKPALTSVDNATIKGMAKGQLLGIPGAPDNVPGADSLVDGTWTVCDTSSVDPARAPSEPPTVSTTAILGERGVDPAGVGSTGALVTAGGDHTYLLWGGRRSHIDPADHAVALAVGTDGVTPRPISSGLLNAIPAGSDLVAPKIDGVGEPSSWDPDIKVGTVFRVDFSTGPAEYVALPDGVQRITPVLSDLIRATYANDSSESVPTVPLSTLRAAPQVTDINVSEYPPVKPTIYGVSDRPVLCLSWSASSGYAVYPASALPVPADADPVPAPPGSAAGTANAVYLEPGHGALVGQVIGNQKPATGALFLVTDSGVKYPVVSRAAASFLGLGKTGDITGAPPALLSLLPTGPVLDPDVAAQFARTGS